jgi:hypothetical protein
MFVLEKYGQQKKNILKKLWETKKNDFFFIKKKAYSDGSNRRKKV